MPGNNTVPYYPHFSAFHTVDDFSSVRAFSLEIVELVVAHHGRMFSPFAPWLSNLPACLVSEQGWQAQVL